MFKINSYQNNLKTNISHLRSNNVKYNDSMIHNMKIHNYINTLFNSISNNTNNLSKNILYNTNYDFDIVKNKFESYNTNLSKKKMRQIFNFILRCKMAGDMVQAYEARRTNTTFPSLYDNSIKILTTQDRLLSQYSMIEENINFISKFTDDGVPYLFYNLE